MENTRSSRPKAYPPQVRSKAIAMIKAGKTGNEIAQKLGVSKYTVWQWARKKGLSARIFRMQKKEIQKNRPEPQKVVAAYLSGKSLAQMAQELNASKEAIVEVLKKRGHDPSLTNLKVLTPPQYQEFISRKGKGEAFESLASYFGVKEGTLRSLWSAYKGPEKDAWEQYKRRRAEERRQAKESVRKETVQRILSRFKAGDQIGQIAETEGISPMKVRGIISRQHKPKRTPRELDAWILKRAEKELIKRYLAGEKVAALRQEYGVIKSSLKRFFKERTSLIKEEKERLGKKLLSPHYAEIESRLKSGGSYSDVAREFSLPVYLVREFVREKRWAKRIAEAVAKERRIQERAEKKRKKHLEALSAAGGDEIVYRYCQGYSLMELAQTYSVRPVEIEDILRQHGINFTDNLQGWDPEKVYQEHLAGATVMELAQKYPVTPWRIRYTIKTRGLKV